MADGGCRAALERIGATMHLRVTLPMLFAGICIGTAAPAFGSCPPRPDPSSMVARDPPTEIEQTGKPLKRVPPAYPICAVGERLDGLVDLVFMVQPDGSVGDMQIVQEVPAGFGFAQAAVKALSQWKFEPKLVDGTAVAFRTRVRLTSKYMDITQTHQ